MIEENHTDGPPSQESGGSKAAGRKGDSSHMEQQLEQEMRYSMTLQKLRRVWELLPSKDPDTVIWSVTMLETSVAELEQQLQDLKNGADGNEGAEFRLRYEAQVNLNKKLEEQIQWYESEVSKMKEQSKKGNDYSLYDSDLDNMTEFELAQLVKVLERDRNNLYGDLRSKSWLLDSHSKEYYHYKELSNAYIGDLNHINRSLEYFWRQKTKEDAFVRSIPSTSPGSMKWSDGDSGINPSQRILDPRMGPVRKTAGVRLLPRLEPEDLDAFEGQLRRKRTKSTRSSKNRTKSLGNVRSKATNEKPGHRSVDGSRERLDEYSTSAEPPSEPSEEYTVDSLASSMA